MKKSLVFSKDQQKLFIGSLLVALITYHLLIINQYNSPDCIVEGIAYYNNAHWSLQGGGRFMSKYISLLTNNVVVPLFAVLMQAICAFFSSLMLKELWGIEKKGVVFLISALMVASPTAIFLMTYTYSALGIGLALLAGVGFVYCVICLNSKWRFLGAVVVMALLLGADQGFIGVASLCSLTVLVIGLVNNDDVLAVIRQGVGLLVSAILGGGLYMVILNSLLAYYKVSSSDDSRLNGFSFSKIMGSLPEKVLESYSVFVSYLSDPVMKRKYLYLLIVLLFVVSLVLVLWRFIRKRDYLRVALIVLFVALIPMVANVIVIIVPYYTIYVAMEMQMSIFVAFVLAFYSRLFDGYALKFGVVVLAVLLWSYVLSANCLFMAYRMSYEHINSQMQMVLTRIYDNEEYVKDETPIMIAGFPDDNVLRENPIYYYAIDFPKNPVFWEDMVGATYVRQNYFRHYFGIDAKEIDEAKYGAVIESDEFKEMGIWPAKSSVKMIDGYMVVRFWDNPPHP